MEKLLATRLQEKGTNTIRVELLGLSHLFQFPFKDHQKFIPNFHSLLITNGVAKAEESINNRITSIQPRCLVALEGNRLLASVILKPSNKRGTCWSISLPKVFKEPIFNSLREVKFSLMKKSLDLVPRAQTNWLVKYPTDCIDELSIARELGFQPHKIINIWSFKSNNHEPFKKSNSLHTIDNSENNIFTWERINKSNARSLWKLEMAGESVHLREIIDRQLLDIINLSNDYTGLLFCNNEGFSSVIAGLIKQDFPDEITTLKFLRDIIWDNRLNNGLTQVLNKLSLSKNKLFIETNTNDEQINKLFNKLGLIKQSERLLLGKTILKRNRLKSKVLNKTTIESMLQKLTPSNSPQPSPSVSSR
ncbi:MULTISPECIES: hypothetical protein [unclassified Prochlorococcus]|uniref:hypothetical protein n=1 Tax=unclassified Prochlorococcus TaxID=2627481 RepID=UPI000533B88F|nr:MULTISPECIES: hypothetical protein [unclassified Prochlorococcus]KGG15185.1 hypothetical protein EV06_1053 [Prochlorococcus sp. MIT 0602]KGG17459.1 hypothetical protein EV07_0899 [Prochlorococcus sp. MIT 0603]